MRKNDKLGGDFYRNLLTDQGKQAYDAIIEHFSKGYAETMEYSAIHSEKTPSDCFEAYKAVRRDHPEMFYLGNNLVVLQLPNGKFMVKFEILYHEEQIGRIKMQLRRQIYRTVSGTADKRFEEKERMVYERIVRRIKYQNNQESRDHNIVGPILFQNGVCEGINAFLMLCLRRVGIPCIKVTGKASTGVLHCWTIAWVNGIPVHLDATWEEPEHGEPAFRYYNLSDRMISKDHFNYRTEYLPVCENESLVL